MKTNRIFIVGYMGAGKTTTSKRLANKLGWDWLDTDTAIEEQQHKSVEDIFKEFGEERFRALESEMLKQTESRNGIVVSTGGGTPCYNDNMEWMNAHGFTIFIQVSPESAINRIVNSKRHRPLLDGKTPDELKEFVRAHYELRLPFYQKAQMCIKGESLNVDDIIAMMELHENHCQE